MGQITKGNFSNITYFYKIVNLFLENVFCVIAAGGSNTNTAVKVRHVLEKKDVWKLKNAISATLFLNSSNLSPKNYTAFRSK